MANKRKSKKLTLLQQEFRKERNRLQQAVRRASKRGYEFPDNIVPEMPKRVTKKALERIKAIKPNDLYKKATYTDTSTGEILKGEIARKLEKQAVALKSAETRKKKQNVLRETIDKKDTPELQETQAKEKPSYKPDKPSKDYNKKPKNMPSFHSIVVQNFKAELVYFPDEVREIFYDWIEKAKDKVGINGVAEILQEAKAQGLIQYSQFASSGEGAQATILGLTKIANELYPLDSQNIVDSLEFEEDWELPE